MLVKRAPGLITHIYAITRSSLAPEIACPIIVARPQRSSELFQKYWFIESFQSRNIKQTRQKYRIIYGNLTSQYLCNRPSSYLVNDRCSFCVEIPLTVFCSDVKISNECSAHTTDECLGEVKTSYMRWLEHFIVQELRTQCCSQQLHHSDAAILH